MNELCSRQQQRLGEQQEEVRDGGMQRPARYGLCRLCERHCVEASDLPLCAVGGDLKAPGDALVGRQLVAWEAGMCAVMQREKAMRHCQRFFFLSIALCLLSPVIYENGCRCCQGPENISEGKWIWCTHPEPLSLLLCFQHNAVCCAMTVMASGSRNKGLRGWIWCLLVRRILVSL